MNLMSRFLDRTEFSSYEDFFDHFKINTPPDFNFAFDVVDVYATEQPEKRALVWCDDHGHDRLFTFADLSCESRKAANAFQQLGIRKGDNVMLIMKGHYQFWICLLALHRIGAAAVPATHMLTAKDLIYRIEKSQLKMAVCVNDARLMDDLDQAQAATGGMLTIKASIGAERPGWHSFEQLIADSPDVFPRPSGADAPALHDNSLIYFSSGTTGMPKMVALDFAYPLGHIITAGYWQNVQDDGLHCTVADTGWAKCVWGKIYGQWICGSAVFAYDYDQFDAGNMLEKCAQYRVSTFCAPPTVYRLLIKKDMSHYDLSHLKYVVTAGEPLNPEVYEKFLEYTGLKLMEGFGQTELVVTIATWPWMKPKPGSMGRPSPGYHVELHGTDGCRVETGEEGEIVLRTDIPPPGMFSGYHHDSEKTAGVWHDGFYHTGDMAWQDEDGYFWFVGRDDDIIKSSGYKVGPFEVESALIEHPAVLECAITGVPDRIRGQAIKASVVLTPAYQPSEELKIELQNHVKKVTAPYKYPRVIDFVKELPKTISGKIRRVEIRTQDADDAERNG